MSRNDRGGMIRHHPARDLWEARYTAANGKRRSLYARTRREAQERLRAALLDADRRVRPADTRVTVNVYLSGWLASSVALRNRPRTAPSYADTADRYIVPAIGARPALQVDPGTCGSDARRPAGEARRARAPIGVDCALLPCGAPHRFGARRPIGNGVAKCRETRRPTGEDRAGVDSDDGRTGRDVPGGGRWRCLRAMYVMAIGTGLRQ